MTRTEKAIATREAKKTRMQSQTITINDDWRILRADPLNWEIQYKGRFQGYYGSISSALAAVPRKMLNEEAKGTLNDVLRCVENIRATLEKAIP